MESLMKEYIANRLSSSQLLIEKMANSESLIETIKISTLVCVDALKKGKKILLAGNGGSAADAQHMAGEFVSRFIFDRSALSAIALTTDTSILTAIGNDYGFENIFSRQIEAIGHEGDIFIAYSTSGKSKNILMALNQAKKSHLISIGMTGNQSAAFKDLCDYTIEIPSSETPHIQEGHLMVGHTICGLIEEIIFRGKLNA
jgi:D-sedoheptulose 7-phosphate isomerase